MNSFGDDNKNLSEIQVLSDSIKVQGFALKKLEALSQQANTPKQAASILEKKIENEERLSRLHFEYANAIANQSVPSVPLNLTEYQKVLRQIIQTANQYLTRFPSAAEAQSVLLLRGKTFQTLEMTALAENDFDTLCFKTARNLTALTGGVALTNLRFDKGNFALVISTVDKIKLTANEKYYGEIQIKKALAYSKLEQHELAINTIQSLLPILKNGFISKKDWIPDSLLKEGLNAAVEIEVLAFSKKLAGVSLSSMVRLLSSNLAPGLDYSPFEFLAFQLIAKDQKESLFDLENYSKYLIAPRMEAEVMSKYFLLCLEYDLDHQLLGQALISMKRLNELVKKPEVANKFGVKLYKSLTHALDVLRTSRLKVEKNPLEVDLVKNIDQCLMYGYDMVLSIPSHPKQDDFILYYNLAELQFKMNAYPSAIKSYFQALAQKESEVKKEEIWLKIVSTRYQDFLGKDYFPKELKPVSMSSGEVKKISVDPLLIEWMKWLDDIKPNSSQINTFAQFDFESCRSLYGKFDTVAAMNRLPKIIAKYYTNAVSLKAALLYFDTFFETKDWSKMNQFSTRMLSQLPDKKTYPELIEKLKIYQLNSDFELFNQQFTSQHYPEALKQGLSHLQKFPNSLHREEVLSMLGLASVATGDRLSGKKYFGMVSLPKASEELRSVASANEIDLALESHDYVNISKSFSSYSQSGLIKKDEDKNKNALNALDYAWMSQDPEILNGVILSECNNSKIALEVSRSCSDYSKWLIFINQVNPEARKISDKYESTDFGKVVDAIPKVKENFKNFEIFQGLWGNLNSLQKTALIAYVDDALQVAFAKQRSSIRTLSPVKLDKNAIQKRTKLISAFESNLERIKKMEWVSIQYHFLKMLALSYQDFQNDILNISIPKGMETEEINQFKQLLVQNSMPFQKLALSYNTAAVSLNSKKAEHFDAVKALSSVQWTKKIPDFEKSLNQAVAKKNVVQVAHLLQFAQKQKLLKEDSEKLMMSIILVLSRGFTEASQLLVDAKINQFSNDFEWVEAPPVRVPATNASTQEGSK